MVVLRVDGAIDRRSLGYLDDRLAQAERDGAVVVLQLDTSGTLDQDGIALAQKVADLDVPVLAWVGPTPAKASGAGLLLMYASSLAGVAPGSQTGPQHPIDLMQPDAVSRRARVDDPGLARRAREGHRARVGRHARCRPPTRSTSASRPWRRPRSPGS